MYSLNQILALENQTQTEENEDHVTTDLKNRKTNVQ